MAEPLGDLSQLDRMVAEASRSLSKFRTVLGRGQHADAPDPFDRTRAIAGASAVADLRHRNLLPYEASIREALVRWACFLTEARIGLPLEIAWHEEAAKELGRLDHDPPRLISFREAIRGTITARSEEEARRFLQAGAERAVHLAPILRERRARTVEVRTRLGTPIDNLLPDSSAALAAAADVFLTASRDLATAMRPKGVPATPAGTILDSLGRDATEGWPARATTRWLEELFGAFSEGLTLELPALPRPSGGATFARILETWGSAFRRACSAKSLPFCLAQEPLNVSAIRSGLLFGSLLTRSTFHKAALGTVQRTALAQARTFARVTLFRARLIAVATLLEHGDDRFDELTYDLFGAPLDHRYAGAFPTSMKSWEPDALALFTLRPLESSLVEAFDNDWFQNPKAFAHLRSVFAGPAREEKSPLDLNAEAKQLAVRFEKALG